MDEQESRKIIQLALIRRQMKNFARDPGEEFFPVAAPVIPFPGKAPSGILQQIEAQMPRLEQLYNQRVVPQGQLPKLEPDPGSVTRIFKAEPRPRDIHFLGGDYTKWGGDTYSLGHKTYNPPAPGVKQEFNWHYDQPPFPGRGVGYDFKSEADAKRALLRWEILRQREARVEQWLKPVKPEISEFASPEAARQSWRLIE